MFFSKKTGYCIFAAVLCCALAAPAFAAPSAEFKQAVKQGEYNMEVKSKLDQMAREHVARANATMSPGRNHVAVTKLKKEYIATFREIDASSVVTEIYPSTAPGTEFVGHIIYLENEYECIASSKKEALNGEFKKIRARRVRELFRYNKGSWQM